MFKRISAEELVEIDAARAVALAALDWYVNRNASPVVRQAIKAGRHELAAPQLAEILAALVQDPLCNMETDSERAIALRLAGWLETIERAEGSKSDGKRALRITEGRPIG